MERVEHRVKDSDRAVVHEASDGEFARGVLASGADSLALDQLAGHLVDENPPHLSARFAEDYVYRLLPDTSLWGRPTQVISIAARTNTPLRRALYFLDGPTLVALYWEEERNSLFSRESAEYFVQMRPLDGGSWAPYHLHISSRLVLPFMPARSLRRSITLFDYQDASSKHG